MNPFQSLHDYEEFIYTLIERFPLIVSSTLIIVRRGTHNAITRGELNFANGYRVTVRERLSADNEQVVIEEYGYELWQNGEKFAWYDSQAHPSEPSLAGTHPHHKHVQPDIKHNRIPAPGLSFNQPNLPLLIDEIQTLLQKAQ